MKKIILLVLIVTATMVGCLAEPGSIDWSYKVGGTMSGSVYTNDDEAIYFSLGHSYLLEGEEAYSKYK